MKILDQILILNLTLTIKFGNVREHLRNIWTYLSLKRNRFLICGKRVDNILPVISGPNTALPCTSFTLCSSSSMAYIASPNMISMRNRNSQTSIMKWLRRWNWKWPRIIGWSIFWAINGPAKITSFLPSGYPFLSPWRDSILKCAHSCNGVKCDLWPKIKSLNQGYKILVKNRNFGRNSGICEHLTYMKM